MNYTIAARTPLEYFAEVTMKNVKKGRTKTYRLRYFRNLLLTAIIGLLTSFYLIIPVIQVNQVIHPPRQEVCCSTPTDVDLEYDEISFITSDGLALSGWYIPSQNHAAIVVLHGSGGNRLDGLNHAEMLVRNGYGVLLFDLRAHGNSKGDTFAFGWETEDTLAAIKYLQSRSDVDRHRVGGLGLSAGGQVLLQAAIDTDQIQAVISDGAGAHTLEDALVMRNWYLSPGILVFYKVGELLSGVSSPPALSESVHQISPRPVMFISAEYGSFGEKIANQIYYAVAQEPKTLWEIAGAHHVTGIFSEPEKYEMRVVSFFDSVLLDKQ